MGDTILSRYVATDDKQCKRGQGRACSDYAGATEIVAEQTSDAINVHSLIIIYRVNPKSRCINYRLDYGPDYEYEKRL